MVVKWQDGKKAAFKDRNGSIDGKWKNPCKSL